MKTSVFYMRIPMIAAALCITLLMSAQVRIDYTNGRKTTYQQGDRVELSITLRCVPETCLSGMRQSKIFLSGLGMVSQTDWKQLGTGLFQKLISVEITEGKSKESKLTVMRRVDKESLFRQEIFKTE